MTTGAKLTWDYPHRGVPDRRLTWIRVLGMGAFSESTGLPKLVFEDRVAAVRVGTDQCLFVVSVLAHAEPDVVLRELVRVGR